MSNNVWVPPELPDGYHPPRPPQTVIMFPAYVPTPPASSARTAAGAFAIALALIELVHFFPTWSVALPTGSISFSIQSALLLVSALGSFALGVAMLAGRRGRGRAVPILLAGFATLAALLCLADVVSVNYSLDILIPTLALTIVPALAVLVLSGSALVTQKAPHQ